MSAARHRSAWRRTETWLWTGPAGHLVGGALDLIEAFVLYAISRARARGESPSN
jgi:hypothetical protein